MRRKSPIYSSAPFDTAPTEMRVEISKTTEVEKNDAKTNQTHMGKRNDTVLREIGERIKTLGYRPEAECRSSTSDPDASSTFRSGKTFDTRRAPLFTDTPGSYGARRAYTTRCLCKLTTTTTTVTMTVNRKLSSRMWVVRLFRNHAARSTPGFFDFSTT